jgi:hypothetical protein
MLYFYKGESFNVGISEKEANCSFWLKEINTFKPSEMTAAVRIV